jgi:hypothetical protein
MTSAPTAGGGRATRLGRIGLALAALALAAGCTSADPGVATADDGPTVTTPPPTKTPLEHELEFIACMRAENIDMTDPIPGDTSGRSAVKHELDVNGQGSNPAFQAALDTCMHLLPPPPPEEPPSPERQEAGREFAQCMRDNGVPDYPDPGTNGDSWIALPDRSDPVVRKAFATCAPELDAGPVGPGTPAPPRWTEE